mmetsp:Transcript_105841/g.147580  ORF Transcript_105841/g.147580 Transcript_105841/m.147580 type:complete len:224 (-) Transcript_105841:127-798(-)
MDDVRRLPDVYKVAVFGDTGAGKTSILQRCADREFDPLQPQTIGVDFLVKTVAVDADDNAIRVQLWDVSGQPRFRRIASAYSRGISGMVLVYDVTKADSFEEILNSWVPVRDEHCRPGLPTILLGNKTDAVEANRPREVLFEQGQQMANRIGAKFMEVSAKSGVNCHPMLDELARDMLSARYAGEDERQEAIRTVTLSPATPPKWHWLFQLSLGWKSCMKPST